jgi:hypothetical protein
MKKRISGYSVPHPFIRFAKQSVGHSPAAARMKPVQGYAAKQSMPTG